MTDRTEAMEALLRAARQVVLGERALGGEVMPAGEPGPQVDQSAGTDEPAPPSAGERTLMDVSAAPGEQSIRKGLMSREQKAVLLDEIERKEVRECVKCELHRSRTRTVFGVGNPDADLMFIGEGPGADEDAQGMPFVGRAGQKLNEMIAAMGLRREDVYIANVVKCRPPDNRPPLPEEVAACWSYLERQIRTIAPRVIVVLGNAAAKALLHTDTGITRLRGQWQQLWGIPVMPTFHPAYLLRQYTVENRQKIWSDLKAVMTRLGMKPQRQ